MPYKRKRPSVPSKTRSFKTRAKRARTSGRTGYANVLRVSSRVDKLYKMIETKESEYSLSNQQVSHNNVFVWTQNPFDASYGNGDPMAGAGVRIGDSIALKGLASTWFVEGSLSRSKVYFRIMFLRGPRGASFDRSDIFKGVTSNKMIDQMNTKKYSVLASKRFTLTPPNTAPTGVSASGVPNGAVPAGVTGNKIVKFWIPGRKVAKNGLINYENGSQTVKFYDYRWVVLAYDWYGTPQDANNVGFINEAWSKMYFKDA